MKDIKRSWLERLGFVAVLSMLGIGSGPSLRKRSTVYSGPLRSNAEGEEAARLKRVRRQQRNLRELHAREHGMRSQ